MIDSTLTESQRALLKKHPSLLWAVIYNGTAIFDSSYQKPRMEAVLREIAARMPAKVRDKYSLRLITFRFASPALTAAKEAEDARFNAWLENELEKWKKEQNT